MALTKYELVNTGKLKAVYFEGETIPLDKIDDALAERMMGKTHILKAKSPAAAAKAQLATEASK